MEFETVLERVFQCRTLRKTNRKLCEPKAYSAGSAKLQSTEEAFLSSGVFRSIRIPVFRNRLDTNYPGKMQIRQKKQVGGLGSELATSMGRPMGRPIGLVNQIRKSQLWA